MKFLKDIIKRIGLIFIVFILIQCSDNFSESPNYDKKNTVKIAAASNSTTSVNTLSVITGSYAEVTDATGTIHVKTFYAESDPGQLNTLSVQVDPAYVVIGGGAGVPSTPYNYWNNANALLTESRPDFGNNAWVGSSKDHVNASVHQLVVNAIGLRIDGITPSQLKSYMTVVTNTSGTAQHPAATVSLPAGYSLIGGGATDNWSGVGNLLVASYPIGNSWYAEGKDHIYASAASMTVYAIGILNYLPNYGSVATAIYQSGEAYSYAASGLRSAYADGGWNETGIPTCGGGRATYNGIGRMLYGVWTGATPNNYSGAADSKDHLYYDNGNIYAYMIKLKKQ